jgi:hypothetical protein
VSTFPDERVQGGIADWLVVAVPLFYLAATLLYSASMAPWGRQVDPESAYAMNGLAAAAGYPFMKNDHPGTTTILLVDIIIRLWAIVARPTDIVEFGLSNYVAIIYVARTAQALILFAVLVVSGVMVRNATRSSIAAMLFQIAPFVNADEFNFETVLIPESLMVACGILGMAFAIKAALSKMPTVALGIASSLTFALGLSAKYLHLPTAFLAVSLVRNPRAMAAAILAGSLGFFVFNRILNPNVFTYGFHWLVRLATHKGVYGEGDPGFIDFDVFWTNMADIIAAAPIGCAILLAGGSAACAQVLKTRRYLDPVSLTLLAAFVAFSAQLVATSKHFALHYMMASWALTGGALVLTIVEVKRLFPRLSPTIPAGIAAVVSLVMIATTIIDARRDAIVWIASNRIGKALSRAVMKSAPACANVSGMFVRAPENILNHGGDLTLGTQEIEDRFSNAYVHVFDVPLLDHSLYRDGLIKNFHAYSYADLAKEYPCIVVRSFWNLDSTTSKGLLELHPEHCVVNGINVYTVGFACMKIENALQDELQGR